MKKIKLFTAFLLLAATLAVSAFAAVTVTYDIQSAKTDNNADCYKIVATLTDAEGDFRGFVQTVTFDKDIFVPIEKEDGTALDLTSGSSTSTFPLYGYYYKTSSAKVNASFVDIAWTVTGSKVELTVETLVTPDSLPANNMAAMSIYFKYADGKSASDITADSFKVNKITYANGDYNYYGRDDEGDQYKTNLTVVNSVVPAATVTEYWSVGNGYNIIENDKTQSAANSPVTKTNETKTKLTVSHGGYYQGKDNWGGVASKDTYTVDGLQIEVKFNAMPTSTDCWAYIGVLKNPAIFDASSGSNPGYVNLIRYAAGNMSVHKTSGSFGTIATVGDDSKFFKISAGDTLKVCFDKNASGKYDVTYIKNNSDVLKVVNSELDLETALGGTKGHVVVSASCLGSQKDAFNYTVDVNPKKSAVSSIDVKKDDVLYFYTVDADTEEVELTKTIKMTADGAYSFVAPEKYYTIFLNRGYTKQLAYNVNSEGEVFQQEEATDTILGSADVSVRTSNPQGIRFFGSVNNALVSNENYADSINEYGFIMTAESAYNKLGDDYVLDMDLVKNGKAKKGIAYDKNADGTVKTDIYFSRTDAKTVIAGVFYGVPKTADALKTVIASRPYIDMGGTYVYGEVTKASLYDIAKAIYGNDDYKSSWTYAKQIIDIVEGTGEDITADIPINVGSLYE